ncbi:TetR/AcrR family transcriptional regulator [Nannocystis sp. SCPEA4]|uniref:TetR/AcrR family transcriptional regulator n=1 Tax=Nannocystis sp. SCPEA4 TaxID=2996787 RepID=UPI0022706EE5|nr:TetR/AcrR family transcriptional regulator [Nannocystis sp. SCPEA4]
MPRPREFDRDEAVERAMAVFWEHGYEATSTEQLLQAMGIGRQSMYAAFGDKHGLYLAALERYQARQAAALLERLRAVASPLAAIEDILLGVAGEAPEARARGCMGIQSIVELAQRDPDVVLLARSATALCEAAFERMVAEAKCRGELGPHVDERSAGRFLLTTLQGLRISARTGATPEALRAVAGFAVAALKAPPPAPSS